MKRILINGTEKEEKRAAFLVDNQLYDLDIELGSKVQLKSNIYLGRVSRIEPSLDAAFVNFGSERHGFLPYKEIHHGFFNGKKASDSTINNVLTEGQEILVQVDKEERGSKGAALTTYVTLAGRCIVYLPRNPNAGGISRKLSSEDRSQMKSTLQQLDLPPAAGVIIRTAGVGRPVEDVQADLKYLKQLWQVIEKAGKSSSAPQFIYQDNNFIGRIIRDYMQDDIDEVIIDNQLLYDEFISQITMFMPEKVHIVSLYEDESIPIFSKYSVEEQIESVYKHEIALPSGGSIVIDHTEALVSIDINSSKSTRGSDIEETALHTNLEACAEIARQLRLRDIGGLIVIDFIDMGPAKNIRQVEDRLKEYLRYDRARVQNNRISRFGLLEMSRQRLRQSLSENSTVTCSKCMGQGYIRTTESLSLSIFRLVQQQSNREKTAQVRARLPVSVATYLLNEKRDEFAMLETAFSVSIILIPVPEMTVPNYEITWVATDGRSQLISSQEELENTNIETENRLRNKVLSKMKPVVNLRASEKSKRGNFFKGLFSIFSTKTPQRETPIIHKKNTRNTKERRGRNRHYTRRKSNTQKNAA